jgi:hypothetical protein
MRGEILRHILVFILALKITSLYADDYHWDFVNALTGNDIQSAEKILSENYRAMSTAEKRVLYGFVLDYTRNENTLRMLALLQKYNFHASQFDLFNAINKSHFDGVVDFILNDGIRPNGEILLLASAKERWNLAGRFIEMGADVNYKYSADKSYADGMTALMYAAGLGNLEIIKLLVDRGANVNLRANNGSTAASIASQNGQPEIYTYLKEHGALDFDPRPAVPNEGAPGNGIASLIDGGTTVLSNGTYRLSGGNTTIRLLGNNKAGNLIYTKGGGETGNGVFYMVGNNLTIIMEGLTFAYKTDSNISFSGQGEAWVRIGD